MKLFDINVLIYSHREDSEKHSQYKTYVEEVINSELPFGFSELAASGFVRIVTHPKIFKTPTPLANAFSFINKIRNRPNSVIISPGIRHWDIFQSLCSHVKARGNLIPDAYFAALAIESGCTWITTDRDYSRFPNLSLEYPFNS